MVGIFRLYTWVSTMPFVETKYTHIDQGQVRPALLFRSNCFVWFKSAVNRRCGVYRGLSITIASRTYGLQTAVGKLPVNV